MFEIWINISYVFYSSTAINYPPIVTKNVFQNVSLNHWTNFRSIVGIVTCYLYSVLPMNSETVRFPCYALIFHVIISHPHALLGAITWRPSTIWLAGLPPSWSLSFGSLLNSYGTRHCSVPIDSLCLRWLNLPDSRLQFGALGRRLVYRETPPGLPRYV